MNYEKGYEVNVDSEVERKLPELKHIDESDLKDIIAEKELTLLENEIALLDTRELGLNLHELDDTKISFLFNYVDNEMVNSYTGRKTKNDMTNAFIMSFNNGDTISRNVWDAKNEYDDNGKVVGKSITIKDFPLYRKWKLRAVKYWNEHKLNDYHQNMKTLIEGNLDRAEVLKEAIFSDAVSDTVSERVKLDSRKQMIDILGLKKERNSREINIFHQGGGRELVESIDSISKSFVNVMDAEFDEIDGDDDE